MLIWIFYALLSAFFFAIKDIVTKKFLTQDVSPKQVLFEQFFLLLLIVVFVFFPTVDFSSFKTLWHLYLLKAVAITVSNVIYMRLLRSFDISSVSPLLNLTPVLLLLMSTTILGEIITPLQLLGVLIMIVSTYFLEVTIHFHRKNLPHKFHLKDLKEKDWSFFIKATIMISFYSIAAISDKLILNQVNVYTNLYFTALFIFSFFVLYYLKKGNLLNTAKHIIKEPQTLVIAIFSMISNFLALLAIAAPGALVSLVIPIRRTSTLMSSLIGGVLFHEKHLKKKIIITIFMVFAFMLIVLDATFIQSFFR